MMKAFLLAFLFVTAVLAHEPYGTKHTDSSEHSSGHHATTVTSKSPSRRLEERCVQCNIILVNVHVITAVDEVSPISDAVITSMMAILNENYNTSPFYFRELSSTINRVTNDPRASDNPQENDLAADIGADLRRGGPDVLNIYFTKGTCSCCMGFASIPEERGFYPKSEYSRQDYVFLCDDVDVSGTDLTHQVGHWLGVFEASIPFTSGELDRMYEQVNLFRRKLEPCSDQQNLESAFLFDLFPDESNLVITAYSAAGFPSESFKRDLQHDYVQKRATFESCYPKNTLYGMAVTDAFENGIDIPGFYNFMLNGRLVAAGGTFADKKVEAFLFGGKEDCDDTETEFRLHLDFQFDDNPAETTWKLTNTDTNAVLLESKDTYFAGDATYSSNFANTRLFIDQCLPIGNYEFTIEDANGNGITNGYYQITLNEKLFKQGGGSAGFQINESTAFNGKAKVPPAPFGICFSGDSEVEVENKGSVKMSDLAIGDYVKVVDNKYEPVYSFGHKNDESSAEFLQIVTKGNRRPLELSKDHMVVIEGGRHVPASLVKRGDNLVTADGDLVVVKTIRTVMRKGIYAPFTASGSIIVNDIAASNYVAFQGSEYLQIAGVDTPFSFHWLAHIFNSVHRVAVMIGFSGESYTETGVSQWVALPHKCGIWLLEQNAVVAVAIVLPSIALFGFVSMIEALMNSSPMVLASLVVGALTLLVARRTVSVKTLKM